MPPFLPRKYLRSPSPEAGPSQPTSADGTGKVKTVNVTRRKPTLFDDLDAGTGSKRSAEHNQALLEKFAATDDSSSLSFLSESEDNFEDVPNANRQKAVDTSEEEDEDMEFEDVETHAAPASSAPRVSGDLELTLRKDDRVSIANPLGSKKGPSKIERQIRIATHQVHVQMLMFHNAIRNAWCCDEQLQQLLVKQLPSSFQVELERWRRNSGLDVKKETPKGKGKGIPKGAKTRKLGDRSQRDWGQPAERLASSEVDMSHGDPLFRLLKWLMNYWKKRFRITAPGLRKLGYMSLQRLDKETKSFERESHDPERHGERIRDLEEFKECAKAMEGSRDTGAQLFTALLRGLGLETRLVANLQPVGFGWSQAEEALEKNPRKLKVKKNVDLVDDSSEDEEDESASDEKPASKPAKKGHGKAPTKAKKANTSSSARRSSRGSGKKDAPINLSDSDNSHDESDEESVIDITPAKKSVQASLPYDKDLVTPSYWTEALSPVTNTYTPIDAVVTQTLATNAELLEKFLPPAKSEKARHITSYVIGHSPDGTAKDVTTRYLKGRMWPGRTKGNRLPAEKIPIHDRKGKVKHYEQYDWFKTVMGGYVRGTKKCPRTDIDDHEEATALKPMKREKKEVEEGKESLQYYKSSSEFVLERHLKREEALLPTAKHVKMFTIKGKGEKTTEEKVFRRKDVVSCKSTETWHKEGRAPLPGEGPLKRVPYRAATTNRRRELAEAEHASGEKVLQGLFSRDQTEWIIPPPIENGIIPKNSFGNIDLYVDSMLPEGAVHIPYRGTVKVCKRLEIDYAEAVTGFEFGHRMAVPIITGVVVAQEHYGNVMAEFEKDEAERLRKEDEKRRKLAISMWRKFLMGMRIVQRMREEYGDDAGDEVDVLNPWTNKKKERAADKDFEARRRIMEQRDEDNAGGFFPEGYEEEPDSHRPSGFFPVAHDDADADADDNGGGFVLEGHDEEPVKSAIGQAYATPQSLNSNGKPAVLQTSEEDKGSVVEDGSIEAEPDVEVPMPKKRGRPASKASTYKPVSKGNSKGGKVPGRRSIAQQKTSSSSKRKRQVEDADDQDDDLSSLSELGSEDLESEVEARPKKAARRATMPAKTTVERKRPKRNAARKSETALRSHYFEHSEDENEE